MKTSLLKSILALFALMAFSSAMAEKPTYDMPVQQRGDVNKDGSVDISDIVAVINHISGSAHHIFSNVNGDQHVDISDITTIINTISDEEECDTLEWEYLGDGTFIDNFWEEGSCKMALFHCKDYPNVYRVADPYGNFESNYYDDNRTKFLDIEILKPGDNLFGTEITQPDLVYFEPFNTGFLHQSYKGYIKLYHPSTFWNDEDSFTYNIVDSYTKDGIPEQIQLAPFFYIDGVGGWNHTKDKEVLTIQFPEYVKKQYIDMKMESKVKGILTDITGQVYAMTDLLTYEYAEKMQFVVVPEDADDHTVADAVVLGETETLSMDFSKPASINVPIPNGLSGKLKVVIVVTNSSEKSAFCSTSFEYTAGETSTWTSLGKGLYTDNIYAPAFSHTPQVAGPYEVEVLESNDRQGLYRMRSPYGAINPICRLDGIYHIPEDIEINATDPDGVFIPYQPTGIEWFSHIASYGGYLTETTDLSQLKEEGYLGKLADDIITLPTFYTEEGTPYQGIFEYYGKIIKVGLEDGFRLVLPKATKTEVQKQ